MQVPEENHKTESMKEGKMPETGKYWRDHFLTVVFLSRHDVLISLNTHFFMVHLGFRGCNVLRICNIWVSATIGLCNHPIFISNTWRRSSIFCSVYCNRIGSFWDGLRKEHVQVSL